MRNHRKLWMTVCGVLLAAVLFVVGFAVGRLTRKPEVVTLDPPATIPEPTVRPTSPPPVIADPTPYNTPEETGEQGAYNLVLNGDKLEVRSAGVVIATMDAPNDLSDAERIELTSGMSFDTLEGIEIWLESFDS